MATVNKDFKVRNGVTAGTLVKGQTLESTIATGTAPIVVASTTAVSNLNADLLDGYHASSFILDADLTTSAHLAGMLGDETGTDKVVFNTSPTFVTSVVTSSETFAAFNTVATTVNAFGAATTLNLGAATGTTTIGNDLTVTGNLTVNGTITTVNSTTITVDDKNLELGSTASPTDLTAWIDREGQDRGPRPDRRVQCHGHLDRDQLPLRSLRTDRPERAPGFLDLGVHLQLRRHDPHLCRVHGAVGPRSPGRRSRDRGRDLGLDHRDTVRPDRPGHGPRPESAAR